MEPIYFVLGLLAFVWALSPVVAIVLALSQRSSLDTHRKEIARLREQVRRLEDRLGVVPAPAPVPAATADTSPTPEPETPDSTPEAAPSVFDRARKEADRRIGHAAPSAVPPVPTGPTPDATSPVPEPVAAATGPTGNRTEPPGPTPRPAPQREADLELKVGERLFNRLGIGVLVIGVALFLAYVIPSTGAWGKITIAAVTGTGMLLGGLRALRHERFLYVGLGLITGGWAVLYALAFALHNVGALQNVDDPLLGMLLLAGVAAAMIGHAVRLGDSRAIVLAHGFAALGVVASTPGPQVGLALAILGVAQLAVADRLVRPAVAVAAVPLTLLGQLVWLLRSPGGLENHAPLQWAFVVQVVLLGLGLWRAQRRQAGLAAATGERPSNRTDASFAIARVLLLLGTALLVALLEGDVERPGPWAQLTVLAVLPALRAGLAFRRGEGRDLAISAALAVALGALAMVWGLSTGGAQLGLAALSALLLVVARFVVGDAGSDGRTGLRLLALVPALGAGIWTTTIRLGHPLGDAGPDTPWIGDATLLLIAVVLQAVGRELARLRADSPDAAPDAASPRPGWLAPEQGDLAARVSFLAAGLALFAWCNGGGVHPHLGPIALAGTGLALWGLLAWRSAPNGAAPNSPATALVATCESLQARVFAFASAVWVLPSLLDLRRAVASLPTDAAWIGIPAPLFWAGVPTALLLATALPLRTEREAAPSAPLHGAALLPLRATLLLVGVLVAGAIGYALFPNERLALPWALLAAGCGLLLPWLASRPPLAAVIDRPLVLVAALAAGITICMALVAAGLTAHEARFALTPEADWAPDDPRRIDPAWLRWSILLVALTVAAALRELTLAAKPRFDRHHPSLAFTAEAFLWAAALLMVGDLALALHADVSDRPQLFAWPMLLAVVSTAGAFRVDRCLHGAARGLAILLLATATEATWRVFAADGNTPLTVLAPVPALGALLLSAETYRLGAARAVTRVPPRAWYPPATRGPFFEPVAFVLLTLSVFDSLLGGGYLTAAVSGGGALLVAYGFARHLQSFRIVGLVTLTLCVVKAFAADLAHLEPVYRILSFLVLGALLVGVSLVYARYGRGSHADGREHPDHDPDA